MASFMQINSNENRSEFAVLKPGWYDAEIINGDVKQSQASTGTYLDFTFRIVDGDSVGRQVHGRFNIVHPNPEAARIGRQQLIGLADAVGIEDPCDTDPFIGKRVQINVTVRPATEKFGESNDIKNYKKYEGTYTPTASVPQTASAPTAGKPTWLQR